MIYAMSVPPVETIQAVATAPQQTSSQGKTDVHKSTYCVDVDDASTLKEFQGAGTDSPPISAYNAIPALLGPMAELGYERDTTTVHGDFILPPNVQASLKTYVITPPKHGVFKLIDVTHFIYGYYPEPGYLGADSVVHSTTKYINGHSDVVGGAVIAADPGDHQQLAWWANCLGVTGSPFDAYQTLRSAALSSSTRPRATSSTAR